ncbi:MAG: hypothetical protein WCD76_03200 [Pyrinomonadaceae bacterium]
MDVKGRKIHSDDAGIVTVQLDFRESDSTDSLYKLVVAVSDANQYDDDQPDSIIYGAYEKARDEILPQLRQALDKALENS